MVELKNKKIVYEVIETTDTMTVAGNVQVDDNNTIVNFSGTCKGQDSELIGAFYYSKADNGKITKNISGITPELEPEVSTLVNSVISEINTSLSAEA